MAACWEVSDSDGEVEGEATEDNGGVGGCEGKEAKGGEQGDALGSDDPDPEASTVAGSSDGCTQASGSAVAILSARLARTSGADVQE